jgi:serine kinase of HPr protein (carbohydrate metabolism regulator)
LRALAAGWRLVADDRVVVWASGGRLFGRAPSTLSGLIEARGLGVLPASPLAWAEIAVVVDLAASPGEPERIPEPAFIELGGVRLRRIGLWALESSAVAKLALALQAAPLGAGLEEAYQAPSHGRGRSARGEAGASHEE